MMESLRAVGYTLGSAVADLVDNSITADASHIDVAFHWAGAGSAIVVQDDGRGMDEDTLREAMRPGTRNPLEERSRKDLGRFGLGLKTASFSQARLLTVASKEKGKKAYARHWDIDLLAKEKKWLLVKGAPASAVRFVQEFEKRSNGTLVVWQNLDRLLHPKDGYGDEVRDAFLEKGIGVKQHLSMVFHRYLEGPDPLTITVNGPPALEPWDPFLRDHPKTTWLEKESQEIFGHSIHVRPYVLPHHSHLSPADHERAGGPRGWNAMQGFYVYREKRLLVAGDYLGLKFLQEPHYSLARIQVDLPNTMDSEWQLDVKKATAVPPQTLRPKLEKIAKITRKWASEVYRRKGRVIRQQHADEDEMVWELRKKHGKKFFAINRKHPSIRHAIDMGGDVSKHVRHVIALVERSMPLESIVYQFQESPDEFASAAEHADEEEIVAQGIALYHIFLEAGMKPDKAREKVLQTDPFGDSAALVAQLDELQKRGKR